VTVESQVKEFQEHARRSLQGDQPGDALRLLTEAREISPTDSTTLMLQGIALSRVNQPAAATDAFDAALAITPQDGKLLMNFAVHLYSYGRKEEALTFARRSAEVRPDSASCLELVRRIEGDLGIQSSRESKPPSAVQSYAYRVGYEVEQIHTIPALGRIVGLWTGLDWFLVFLSVITVGLASFAGVQALASNDPIQAFGAVTVYPMLKGFYLVGIFATVLYGVIDIIDRRGNGMWLIILVLFPLLCLGWIGLPLYMTGGRK
jgi:tetratricopeptide (TPR) repeat protein